MIAGARAFWVPLLAVALGITVWAGVEEALPSPDRQPSPRQALQGRADLWKIQSLIEEGRYEEAEAQARQLLRNVRAEQDLGSVQEAQVLDLLSEAMRRGGKAQDLETLALCKKAVDIKESALGRENPAFALSLHNLGATLYVRGEHTEARGVLEEALAIRERTLGPVHPKVAETADYLGNLLLDLDEDDRAQALLVRSLEIRESRGVDHLEVAWSLNGIGKVLRKKGDYEGARGYFERALEIRKRHLPSNHPVLAAGFHNLAVLLHEQGDYAGAKTLYEEALAIREAPPGEEDRLLASTLDTLGRLAQDMGDSRTARPLYERVLRIYERLYGRTSSRVALSLDRLAALHAEDGDNDEARALFERSLRITETLDPNGPMVARSFGNLGRLRFSQGEYATARLLFERALDIQEKAPGARPLDIAYTHGSLAEVLHVQGDYISAEEHYERGLEIEERTLGPDHPGIGSYLRNLACLHTDAGRLAEAMTTTLRAEEIGRDHLRVTARAFAESQALRYGLARVEGLDLALQLAAEHAREVAWFARAALDALIRSRALILDEMAARNRVVQGSADPEIARLAENVRRARAELAGLVIRGPVDQPGRKFRDRLERARKQVERTERALAARTDEMSKFRGGRSPGLSEVAASLPSDTGLVAYAVYFHYQGFVTGARSGRGEKSAGRDQGWPTAALRPRRDYIAFILRPDSVGPAAVSLGRASEIEDAVSAWRREVVRGVLEEDRSPEEAESAYRRAGWTLRRKIWDPLEKSLHGLERVLVVPDGALHLVSIATLPAETGGYLIERSPLIHYLSAERDLVQNKLQRVESRGMLALGNPAYDDDTLFAALRRSSDTNDDSEESRKRSFRGKPASCASFGKIQWSHLPGTATEVAKILRLWQSVSPTEIIQLTGRDASENAFKTKAPGMRVIHLATHGFFLEKNCGPPLKASRGIGLITQALEHEPPHDIENPLHRSGLVLAGANRRAQAPEGGDDGILTAEEIAAMNLAGVEWAVLSACDTGMGEVMTGEGVLGLRRAFQIAGAATTIMSLWPVEDETTRQWMQALYRARLLRNLPTDEALRDASVSLLNARREEGASSHPFYWGAFIAAGDWR